MNKNRSLKDNSEIFMMDNDKSLENIPAYADESLRMKLEQTAIQETAKQKEKQNELKQREKAEYKKTLIKIWDMNEFLLLTIGFSIIGLLSSLIYMKLNYSIYCIFTAVLAFYIGRRLRPLDDEDGVLNTLMWNLALSINDFFEYKIDYQNINSYNKNLNNISIVFALVVLLFNSNSIVYPIALMALIFMYIISFSQRDKYSILYTKNTVLNALVFGFIFKGILHTCISGVLTLDMFNLSLTIGFVCLYHLISYIDLSEPM